MSVGKEPRQERYVNGEKVATDDALAKAQDVSKCMSTYVPYNVFTFSELESVKMAQEAENAMRNLFGQFISLGENIIFDGGGNKTEMMLNLINEFIGKLSSVSIDMSKISKDIGKSSITLFKSADGTLYWVGVPTNKYIDKDGDIISDAAHQDFVRALKSNEVPLPELRLWHIPVAVGKSTWVDYDDRGFLVAGGTVFKNYQNLVESIVTNGNDVPGMSHLVPAGMYERDESGTITKYRSIEFSLLPNKKAANGLTTFAVEGE